MINVPEKLKGFNFVLIGGDGKQPIEKGWQKKVHRLNDKDVQKHLSENKNYGIQSNNSSVVVNGHSYFLIIVDFDRKDFQDKVISELPETFTTTSGSSKKCVHLWYACDNNKAFKIKDENLETLADVIGSGNQVIAPGSTHSSGSIYSVVKDVPLAFISYNELEAILKKYDTSPKKEEIQKKPYNPNDLQDTIIQKIYDYVSMKDVLKELKVDIFKNPTNCPFHLSKGGRCLGWNEEIAHCFHCDDSWNKFSLIRKAKKLTDKETFEWFAEKAGMLKELEKVREDYIKSKKSKLSNLKENEVELPKTGKLNSIFTKEVALRLKDKNVLFFRTDSQDVVEIGKILNEKEQTYTGFKIMNSNRFITFIEDYILPGVYVEDDEDSRKYKFKHKSISPLISSVVLQSQFFQDSLPKIDRLFTVPLPIIYEGKLTFPKIGYDERFNSWLPQNSCTIKYPEMSVEESKEIIHKIFKEFCFASDRDYIKAVAGLLTPMLRGLYSRFTCRTPLFIYLANRERAGKDYLAGITGLVYEGAALDEPPICHSENRSSSNDELRKKILSALLSGRKRLHFANNKGYLNNSVFEQIITSEVYSDRLLGKNEAPIFKNELEFSLSGNVGIGYTADLSNRSRIINLFLDIEDANARKFENPDLHGWVLANRELILSSLYSLVRNWFEKGCPKGKVDFASFPEWARVCGGIMESAGYGSPCEREDESLSVGGDSETTDMKRLFELCYQEKADQLLTKNDIKDLIEQEGDLFGYLDFNDHSDQIKFGKLILRFVGRIFSDIKMKPVGKYAKSSMQTYVFTKEKKEVNQKLIGDEKNEHKI